MDSKEFIKLVSNVIKVDVRNARINSDEEGVVHDDVGVGQIAHHAALDVFKSRVAQEIAAEEVSGLDAVGFQKCGQVIAGKTGLIFHRDYITEPGGIGVLRGLGQDETVFAGFQHFSNFLEIFFSFGDELIDLL